MFRFACKDLGLNCDYTASSEIRTEVMQAAMKHAITAHAEIMFNFSAEEACEYLKALEAAVKPE